MSDTEWRKTSTDGRAYGRPPQHFDESSLASAPGTPMGELMRRYWQPVLASRNVTDRPREVRILGEDLIVFRDGEGRAGPALSALHASRHQPALGPCRGRRHPLLLPWLEFDVEGHASNSRASPTRTNAAPEHRQPWYPVRSAMASSGPTWARPRRCPCCRASTSWSRSKRAKTTRVRQHARLARRHQRPEVVPYSWLHMNDNVMDPFHVHVLHSTLTGPSSRRVRAHAEVRYFEID